MCTDSIFRTSLWLLERTLDPRIIYAYYEYKRITDIEVSNRLRKEKELSQTIKKRKIFYTGHTVQRLIIEGKVQGKRSVRRLQTLGMKDLRSILVISLAGLRRETA